MNLLSIASVHVTITCDQSLPAQPISKKHNQEKKPTNLCTPLEILKKCVHHV